MDNVLIVEDHDRLREQLGRFYEEEGYRVITANCGEAGIEKLAKEKFSIVVSDVKMPGIDGFQLARHIREKYADTDIILITAFGNVKQAVEAMKLGASDYITKPFQPEAIRLVSEKLIEKRRLLEEVRDLRQRVQDEHRFENILSKSPKMLKVFDLIRSLADTDSGVIITGETGTGKELVARAIHNLSRRKERQFVAINCGAFPDTLLESELFGYEKGAFTGAVQSRAGKIEIADGGTLLDEIETMSPPMQVKLLRVLQEREVERLGGNKRVKVDMRVIAATNVDLSLCVARGSLREDFYYRINVIPVQLPPLRERLEDLPLLIEYILGRHPFARERSIRHVAPKVLDQMLAYHWPGNIRELENILERAIVKCTGSILENVDLPLPPQHVLDLHYVRRNGTNEVSLKQWLLESEKDYLRGLLIKHKGGISQTAKEANVDNKTLYRKMRRHGLHKESFKDIE